MKALVRVPGGVEVCDQPEPVPGPQDVVVAVHSCGICGSDVHAAEFSSARVEGIPGHEFSGTVAQIGGDVHGLATGQAVAVNPLGGCGACEWCQHQLFIRCTARPNLGLNAAGGFAELVSMHQSQVFPLPDGMPLEYGSRVEPLAVGLRAVVEAGSPAGLNAIVFGLGPIGLHLIQVLRAWGANTIVAVGRSSSGRRDAASKIGADVVLDSRETDVADYVVAHGIDVAQAYECSADPGALNTLSRAARVTGTIVAVALGHSPSQLDTHRFVAKAQRMVSACAYGNRDFGRALDLIATGAVDVEPLITERIRLADGPEAFVRLRKPGNLVSVLVQPWST
ncbi:MAG: alcohol dehydrogenase catalytic domain-containing protein [Chloroflexi bacterium]|nr:alcohol dehydrogenase catalytic domain-containing protein [Chloroflexota bacterium]